MSLQYAVVACPRCRRALVVDAARKTASCASCSRALELRDLRSAYSGASLDDARHTAGIVNARLAGREREYYSALVVPATPAANHDDKWSAAAAAARKASAETDRADAVARALGDFDDQDLLKAFRLAGLRDPPRHLNRMVATQIVYEPKPGLYRAL